MYYEPAYPRQVEENEALENSLPELPDNALICPHCDGHIVWIDEIRHEIKDGDWDTPNGSVTDFHLYECPECGQRYKSYKCI